LSRRTHSTDAFWACPRTELRPDDGSSRNVGRNEDAHSGSQHVTIRSESVDQPEKAPAWQVTRGISAYLPHIRHCPLGNEESIKPASRIAARGIENLIKIGRN